MQIIVNINTCKDCRHLEHSGGFTPGGSIPVCGHHDAVYGSHAHVNPGDSAIDVMMKVGMNLEDATKFVAWVREDDGGEAVVCESILLRNYKPGDCLQWMHRVPFTDWNKPSIPNWCPLQHGSEY